MHEFVGKFSEILYSAIAVGSRHCSADTVLFKSQI